MKKKASICVSDLVSRHTAEVAMIAYSYKQKCTRSGLPVYKRMVASYRIQMQRWTDRCMHACTRAHAQEPAGQKGQKTEAGTGTFQPFHLSGTQRTAPQWQWWLQTRCSQFRIWKKKVFFFFLFSKRQTDRKTLRMVTGGWRNNKGASLPSPSLTTVKPNVSRQKNNEN